MTKSPKSRPKPARRSSRRPQPRNLIFERLPDRVLLTGACDHDPSDGSGTVEQDGLGNIIATGTPEDVAKIPESFTGKYIQRILEHNAEQVKKAG